MKKNWTDLGIGVIQDTTRFLWSVASLLAPWLVPIAPATFLGWSVYQTAIGAKMLEGLAIAAAVAAGVGLETVNIAANHAVLHLSHEYEKHIPKFVFSILLVVAYVIAGVVSMIYLTVDLSVKAIGVALFALAPVAIAAQALALDLARVREEATDDQARKDEERVWQRDQDARLSELRLRLDHERRMKRDALHWQHKTAIAVNLPSIPAKSPTTSHKASTLPAWLPVIPDSLDDFRRLVTDGTIKLPANVTGTDLERHIPAVGSDSTGRYWLRQVRNGHDD